MSDVPPGRRHHARHRAEPPSRRAAPPGAHRAPTAHNRALPLVAAVAVTAVASGAGITATAGLADAPTASTGTASAGTATAAVTARGGESGVSRDAARPALEQGAPAFDRSGTQQGGPGGPVRPSDRVAPQPGPREIARSLLPDYGWDSVQYSCLDQLWISESNWDHTATNPTSGAYGIPQSLPAEKMASAGPDWRTNPATQIEWGLEYIRLSYGTPCSANSFKIANNWY